jgi:hypothetical protein
MSYAKLVRVLQEGEIQRLRQQLLNSGQCPRHFRHE